MAEQRPVRLPGADRRTASTGCATSTRRARRCSTAATRSARSCRTARRPAARDVHTTCRSAPAPPCAKEIPIPAGKYVVKIIVPPGYKLQKEEDKNVDFGDTYVPQQFWLTGYPLADGGGPGRGPAGADGAGQRAHRARSAWASCTWCRRRCRSSPASWPAPSPARRGRSATRSSSRCATASRRRRTSTSSPRRRSPATSTGWCSTTRRTSSTRTRRPSARSTRCRSSASSFRDWQGREITRTYTRPVRHVQRARADHLHDQPARAERRLAEHPVGVHQPADDAGTGRHRWCPTRTSRSSTATSATRCSTCRGRRRTSTRPWCRRAPSPATGRCPVDAELPDGTPVIAAVTGPTRRSASPGDLPEPAEPLRPLHRGPRRDDCVAHDRHHVGGEPDGRRPDRGPQPGVRRLESLSRS